MLRIHHTLTLFAWLLLLLGGCTCNDDDEVFVPVVEQEEATTDVTEVVDVTTEWVYVNAFQELIAVDETGFSFRSTGSSRDNIINLTDGHASWSSETIAESARLIDHTRTANDSFLYNLSATRNSTQHAALWLSSPSDSIHLDNLGLPANTEILIRNFDKGIMLTAREQSPSRTIHFYWLDEGFTNLRSYGSYTRDDHQYEVYAAAIHDGALVAVLHLDDQDRFFSYLRCVGGDTCTTTRLLTSNRNLEIRQSASATLPGFSRGNKLYFHYKSPTSKFIAYEIDMAAQEPEMTRMYVAPNVVPGEILQPNPTYFIRDNPVGMFFPIDNPSYLQTVVFTPFGIFATNGTFTAPCASAICTYGSLNYFHQQEGFLLGYTDDIVAVVDEDTYEPVKVIRFRSPGTVSPFTISLAKYANGQLSIAGLSTTVRDDLHVFYGSTPLNL